MCGRVKSVRNVKGGDGEGCEVWGRFWRVCMEHKEYEREVMQWGKRCEELECESKRRKWRGIQFGEWNVKGMT